MRRTLLYWIIAIVIGLILFTSIQSRGQSNSNQIVFDTLVVYKHYGMLMYVDTVNSDTTFFEDNIRSNEGFISDVCAQAFKSEYNISSQLGSYVHGIKVEHTRTADIQPASSGWFGGQFVLNAGTSAWDDINKPSYALQAIIKGDQWDGVQDVNAGRFELQSSGSVKDIVYILANTGTSVSSSMLYMPTHVNIPNMIQFNAQSNSTITNGIDFVTGAGSHVKYGIDFSGATIDTADIRLSSTGKISGDATIEGDVTISADTTTIGDGTNTTNLILSTGGTSYNIIRFLHNSTQYGQIRSYANGSVSLQFIGDNSNIAPLTLYTSGAWTLSGEATSDIKFMQKNANGTTKYDNWFFLDGGTGYIGISTGSPSAKLEIVGNALIDSACIAASYNFASATAVTGTADSIDLNFTPDLPALAAGLKVSFVAEAANTGAATLVVDGGTEKNIYEASDISALEANDIKNGMVVELIYDGTQWQQISQSGN